MTRNRPWTNDRTFGFTLIELLVVISILALVVALLLPALRMAKESGRNIRCMSQVRQINLATMSYTHEFDFFPACAGPDVIFDRADEWGNVRQISERWPSRLLPYLGTTDVFTCPTKLITLPVNNYFANTIFWTGNGQCTLDGTFLLESTGLDDVATPSKVVTYFESTRDMQGDFYWMVPTDIKWWGDYSAKFEYTRGYAHHGYDIRDSGGRHFRTPSSVGGDPWGKDNIAFVDGHLRTQISMQYLVDNEPRGVYHSYPFRSENLWSDWDVATLEAGEPDVGVEFWTVPWW